MAKQKKSKKLRKLLRFVLVAQAPDIPWKVSDLSNGSAYERGYLDAMAKVAAEIIRELK